MIEVPCLTRRCVLVIEDSAPVRESCRTWLQMAGHQVEAACNGQEALDLLRAADRLPDVILLDLFMPVLDGFRFRALQRDDPRLAGVPVVVISGEVVEEAALSRLQPHSILRKPCGLQDMLDAVDAATRN